MRYIYFYLLFLSTNFFMILSDSLEKYLDGRIEINNKRYKTFLTTLELIKKYNVKVIVETGTSRDGNLNCLNDGCSTIIYAHFAQDNDVELYSIDINPRSIERAKAAVKEINQNVNFVCSDSLLFLESFHKKIDFLYLDSFDFNFNNPKPSQEHHLKEIKAAYRHLSDNAIVMVDDCKLPHGGKCLLVKEYLLSKGWEIVEEDYQVIFMKKNISDF